MGFDQLGLSTDVLSAVSDTGYTEPTPIQAQAIPEVLKGRDVLGIAQTGTGKTASFTLPMIDKLSKGRARARMPRSLILEPTRELAAQVAENFETYGKNNKLTMALLIGGVSFADQDRKLDRGVDVLIATPGRLMDHMERGKVMLTGVQILVVDEADRMLDMGFIPDIEKICKRIPFTRQTLFFSATMPPEIQRLTETFLQAPVRIEVARPSSTSENITQRLVKVQPSDKREALRQLIRNDKDLKNAIIFCNRKRDVDIVAKSMNKHGFDAAPLHGDLDQRTRLATLERFKSDTLQFLVASDVAARGLDIPAVSHVINFDVPTHAEDYVHRIGRTARAGLSGTSLTIATRSDTKYLDAIEKLIKQKIEVMPVEGLSTETDSKEDSGTGGGERRGRGRRGPRSKSSPKASSESQRGEAPKQEAKPQAEAKPEPEAKPQRKKRDDSKAPRDAKRSKSEHKPRQGSDNGGSTGLGDHMPAFLKNPVPKSATKT